MLKNKNLYLIITSFFLSIILCEIIAKYILAIKTYDDLGRRYNVDNFYSFSPGFFKNSSTYSLEHKPFYNHLVSDENWYPKQEFISIDKNGYRNSIINSRYDSVLIGDSFVFGFGENQNNTLSGILNSRGYKVYNLGIVGAGPATYIKVTNDFLKKNKVKNISLFFTTANDTDNLNNSCWKELNQCTFPNKGKIYRKDLDVKSLETPKFIILNSWLRYSSLVFLIDNFVKGNNIEIFGIKNNIDFSRFDNYFKTSLKKYLKELKHSHCILNEEIIKIKRLEELIETGKQNEAENESLSLAKKLIKRQCAPISSDFKNLTTYTRGFMTEFTKHEVTYISKKTVNISKDCEYNCNSTEDQLYEKKKIFVNWIKSINNKVKVDVYIVPGEWQIKQYEGKIHWLCDYLKTTKINCNDTRKHFKAYYKNNKHALFLDGAHLNLKGGQFLLSHTQFKN